MDNYIMSNKGSHKETKLETFRKNNSITQQELADVMGLTQQQVSNFCRGISDLSLEYMKKLTDHYKLPFDYFIEDKYTTAAYSIGSRIKEIINYYKITIQELAEHSNIKDEDAIELLENKRLANNSVIDRIAKAFHVNPAWLSRGQAEMFTPFPFPLSDGSFLEVASPKEDYQKPVTPLPDISPKLIKTISMALQVLDSNTHYAEALEKNIFSFHAAVEDKKNLTGRIETLEKMVTRLTKQCDNPLDFQESGASMPTHEKRKKDPKIS